MNTSLLQRLRRQCKCEFKENVALAPFTSFHIGGPAQLFAEPTSKDKLVELIDILHHEDIPYFYLGHGSNILISDDGFPGVVIRARGTLCDIQYQNKTIHAGPGAALLALTSRAAALGLTGMEPLSGIPGSVGGGLYMNAGAYGAEISDTLLEVDVFSPGKPVRTLKCEDIGFGYRSAPAVQNVIILESRYRLKEAEKEAIYSEMRRVWKLRRKSQPLEYPSAGSIFKRPPGDYAGRLIEAVGGKGVRIGGAVISPKHAGFIVNTGGATAADVAGLIRDIRTRVYREFGILLENEVKPIGFKEDPFAVTL